MADRYFLIHFTSFATPYKNFTETERDKNGFNNLLNIIENGFRFFLHDTFTPIDTNYKSGIAQKIGMICFSEVRLSEISQNTDKFGKFGICMKREWIENYLGQPVLYSSKYTINNMLLNKLLELISETAKLISDTENFSGKNDKQLKQISLKIAGIFNHFQAMTEVIDHKYENEWRIIDDTQNEVLNKSLVPEAQLKTEESLDKTRSIDLNFNIFYLPISFGDDAELFIIPKDYEEAFCNRVVNAENNKKKLIFFEDL